MLKQRIITAIALIALLLLTLTAKSTLPFILVLIVMCSLSCWEWLRISLDDKHIKQARTIAYVVATIFILIHFDLFNSITIFIDSFLVPLTVAFWVFGATFMVYQGQTDSRKTPLLLSAIGILASIALWYSLSKLYVDNGAWFLLSLMALVWVADTSAYFVGRKYGKQKLAPKVSPGKTKEGAKGGIIAVVAWMLFTAFYQGSFSQALVQNYGWILMIIISVVLAALSIVGDLFESLLKRRAGVKDSSNLLPGHGGVYDRIDALYPVAPLALLLVG